MFAVRCCQEKTRKQTAFRRLIFGNFSTFVPPITWTPHKDFPLPTSTAQTCLSEVPGPVSSVELPEVTGQLLEGNMISRTTETWKQNEDESLAEKSNFERCLTDQSNSDDERPNMDEQQLYESQRSSEGLEVTELYDLEAGYVEGLFKSPEVKVLEEKEGLAQHSSKDLPDETHVESTESASDEIDNVQVTNAPVRLSEQDRVACYGQSTMDLGIEIDEEMTDIYVPAVPMSTGDASITDGASIKPLQLAEQKSKTQDDFDQEKTVLQVGANKGALEDTSKNADSLLAQQKITAEVNLECFDDADWDKKPLKDLVDETPKESNKSESNETFNFQATNVPVRLSKKDRDACYGQSTMDLGVEIGEEISDHSGIGES